ncbi:GNAT family N-acetyltransferase [Aestuariivivens sediminis]|uniref:GNAT family N-acetyltransferase n=1 Tax=Aestuariivivens sediminis TaxID=2913557 RepID=UPI001F55FBC9|nr:GNAT family N-acetyltransferase [Aestuariivivens sediminis]
MIDLLDWDSRFFNIKVGKAAGITSFNAENYKSFDLIYLVQDITSPSIFLDGYEAALRVTYVEHEKTINTDLLDNNTGIISYNSSEHSIKQLHDLAVLSGQFSRYNLDPNFDKITFERFYRTWINNSIHTDFADDILIYLVDNRIVGFVTYKIQSNNAKIGLIAVNPIYQGKGIGTFLIMGLENILLKKDIISLKVVTQKENIKALKFYEKFGFSISSTYSISHYWKL